MWATNPVLAVLTPPLYLRSRPSISHLSSVMCDELLSIHKSVFSFSRKMVILFISFFVSNSRISIVKHESYSFLQAIVLIHINACHQRQFPSHLHTTLPYLDNKPSTHKSANIQHASSSIEHKFCPGYRERSNTAGTTNDSSVLFEDKNCQSKVSFRLKMSLCPCSCSCSCHCCLCPCPCTY